MSINLDYANRTISISLDDFSIHACRDDGLIIATTFTKDRVLEKHVHSCFYSTVANIALDRDGIKDRLVKKAVIAFDDYFQYA